MKCTFVPGDLVTPVKPIEHRPGMAKPEMGCVYTVRVLYESFYFGEPLIGLYVEEINNPAGAPGWVASYFRRVPRPDISALRVVGVSKPELV